MCILCTLDASKLLILIKLCKRDKSNRGVVLHDSTFWSSRFFQYWADIFRRLSAHYTKRTMMLRLHRVAPAGTNYFTLTATKQNKQGHSSAPEVLSFWKKNTK